MFRKLKGFLNKIMDLVFLVLTLILFLLIAYIIFIYFKNSQIFNNKLYNLIVLAIFYSIVYLFFIRLYYKIFKFTLNKNLLNKKEFEIMLRKKANWRKKTLKKENRIPLTSTKKLKILLNEGKLIDKEFYKGAIFFNSFIEFFIFSIYYGLYIGHPFWAIKKSIKPFPKAVKKFFSLSLYEYRYGWNKFKNSSKEEIYLPFHIPPFKEKTQ